MVRDGSGRGPWMGGVVGVTAGCQVEVGQIDLLSQSAGLITC